MATTHNEITVIGDKILLNKLEKLKGLNVNQSKIRAAFNRASKPMIQQAKSGAKQYKKSGSLWKSIKLLPSRRYKSLFWVGPAHGVRQRFNAWYAYFIESGTKMRKTKNRRITATIFNITLKTINEKNRGRIKPGRFMERAYESNKGRVKLNIIGELNKLIREFTK